MNILYLSKLKGQLWAGPTYSVPNQILAQSKYDNVLWYNLTNNSKNEWKKFTYYKDLDDFPACNLKDLPSPFNKPDLVVFEQIYSFGKNISIINEIRRSKIPYIIIPRSELTQAAQQRKKMKKSIANLFYFNKVINEAKAIQYLTEKEMIDSGKRWNNNFFIIPNGCQEYNNINYKSRMVRHVIYVGRIETYQKGLDLLIDACENIKEILRRKKVVIDIYGPDRDNSRKNLELKINKANISDIIKINEEIFSEEKIAKLNNADAFVMTSRFEGLPMGMIEALSLGLPCLATKGTNLADKIQEYDAGWVAENNVLSISKALIASLEDNDILNKSKNAHTLSKTYSWKAIGELSHKYYEKI